MRPLPSASGLARLLLAVALPILGCSGEAVRQGEEAPARDSIPPDRLTPGGGVLAWPKVTELEHWTVPEGSEVTGSVQASDGGLLLWCRPTGEVWGLDPHDLAAGPVRYSLPPGLLAVDRLGDRTLEALSADPLSMHLLDASGVVLETVGVRAEGVPLAGARAGGSWYVLLQEARGDTVHNRLVRIAPTGEMALVDSVEVPTGSLTARGADVLLAEEQIPHRIVIYSGEQERTLWNKFPNFFDSVYQSVQRGSSKGWKATRVLPFEGGLIQQVADSLSPWYNLILRDRDLEMYSWPSSKRPLRFFGSDTLTRTLYALRTEPELQVVAIKWDWDLKRR